MLELFFKGSKLFIGSQTIVAVIMIVVSVYNTKVIFSSQVNEDIKRRINLIKEIGLFALILGVLGSSLDLMSAFQAIEKAGDVSPSLLAAGLKYTFIPTVYGLMIYALSLLIYFALRAKTNKTPSK